MSNTQPPNDLFAARRPYVTIAAGTTPKIILAVRRLMARKNSDSLSCNGHESLIFDSQGLGLYETALLSDAQIQADELFEPDELVPAQFPVDHQSLERAEKHGKTILMPPGWHRNPAASLDNQGASADPRIGATLALLNRERLATSISKSTGRCLDHSRNEAALRTGEKPAERNGRLVYQIYATAAGGMSNGAVCEIAALSRQQAQAFGIRAKRVVHLLLRGDLPVVDAARADINQANLLKYLRALASGQYIDALTGRYVDCPFDMLFLQSNQNSNGRMSGLDQLIAHESCGQQILWSSPLTESIHQRLTDMEYSRFDTDGDPLCGFTLSVSLLDWNKEKVMSYCGYQAAWMLAEALSSRRSDTESKKEALKLASMHGVLESEQDNRLTAVLLNPASLKGTGLVERMRHTFSQRTEGASGLQKAQLLQEGINLINGTEFSEYYEPLMGKQATAIFTQARDQISAYLNQKLSGELKDNALGDGRFDVLSVIAGYRKLVQATHQVITEKLTQVEQLAEPHEQMINDASRQLDYLTHGSFLRRLLHPFLPRELARCLESYGKIFLEFRLQALACRVAVRHLLDPLLDFLDAKLTQLSMLDQYLRQTAASCKQRARKTAQHRSLVDNPLGFSLVDLPYLETLFGDIVRQNNGQDGLVAGLIARVMSRYGSLGALLEKNADQIIDMLFTVCGQITAPYVQETDVFEEFTRRFTTSRQRLELLSDLVAQSEGRVLTVGEAEKQIVWLKLATVPHERDQQALQQMLEKADPKPGKWQVVVDKECRRICLVQIRGGISLTPLIDRCQCSRFSAQDLIERSVAPASVLIPSPGCSAAQLKIVLAKALAVKQLIYDAQDGYKLVLPTGQTRLLGKKPKDVLCGLGADWSMIVMIETFFFHQLVRDGRAVTDRIDQFHAQLDTATPEAPLMRLIDKPSVHRLTEQVRVLTPRAERLGSLLDRQEDQ